MTESPENRRDRHMMQDSGLLNPSPKPSPTGWDVERYDDLIASLEAELAATKRALFAMQRERDQLKAQLEAKQVDQ